MRRGLDVQFRIGQIEFVKGFYNLVQPLPAPQRSGSVEAKDIVWRLGLRRPPISVNAQRHIVHLGMVFMKDSDIVLARHQYLVVLI